MRYRWLVAGAAALAAAGVWSAAKGQKPEPGRGAREENAALIRHGDYLVNRVVLCGDCHTPLDDRGRPDASRRLQGGPLPIRPKKETEGWADRAPDITRSGLAGKWGEAGLTKFLMTGRDPEGEKAHPPMPAFRLNERDARAITLYLKSLPGKKRGAGKEGGR